MASDSTVTQGIYRIGRIRLMRDRAVNGDWLLRVPHHVIQNLNASTGLSYGTSFDHNSDVTLWQIAQGTYAGAAGSSLGIFIGTGING